MLQTQTFTDIRLPDFPAMSGCRPFVLDLTAELRFDTHLAALPSLDDLVEEMRASDPSFDDEFHEAEERRFEELLAEVDAGRLSRITAERLRLGLTQSELAELAGMRQPNISRLENPGAPIAIETAKRLAEGLGLEDYRVLLP